MYKMFEEKIALLLQEEQIKRNEILAKHTTFRIGGPADYFLTPSCGEQVKEIVALCKEQNIPFYVLGNGSNVLASDEGYKGVIIHIGTGMDRWQKISDENETVVITAGCGIMLAKLAKEVASLGLKGFEFAGGIPGTLGGAIAMNAGAYGGEIKDCILNAKVLTGDGEIRMLDKEELQLGYRSSVIQKEAYIVLEASFSFSKGEKKEIIEKMEMFNEQRREKQPLQYPSAGSTFKRPEGHFAGKLIQDAGLRGYRVGDLMVSEKHCGFVVNVGNGTAKEAKQLMKDVQRIVYEQFQVTLEPEVRFLGE